MSKEKQTNNSGQEKTNPDNLKSKVKQQQTEECDCGCKGNHDEKKSDQNCGCNDNHDDKKSDQNCGCKGNQNKKKSDQNCGCNDNRDEKKSDQNCGCKGNHNEKNQNCGCGDDCDSQQPSPEDYAAVFAQLQHALEEGEKELKAARDAAIDSQRLASVYKKDLDRYKERTKDIEQQAKENATEWTATNLLPIIDQFEAALKVAPQTSEYVGFGMIYNSLKKLLDMLGVAEIEAIGQPFDSNLHNAVSKQQIKDKKQDGVVTAVYQKGYKFKATDKIIRYAVVEIGEYIK